MTVTAQSTLKYTRNDYMLKVCDHQTYYRQFVTSAVVRIVEQGIGRDAILTSTDEHFNDIPLRKWDALGGYSFLGSKLIGRPSIPTSQLIAQANGEGWGISPSDCTCTFKQAAAMIREGLV